MFPITFAWVTNSYSSRLNSRVPGKAPLQPLPPQSDLDAHQMLPQPPVLSCQSPYHSVPQMPGLLFSPREVKLPDALTISQLPAQCLAHWRFFIHVWRMNEWSLHMQINILMSTPTHGCHSVSESASQRTQAVPNNNILHTKFHSHCLITSL